MSSRHLLAVTAALAASAVAASAVAASALAASARACPVALPRKDFSALPTCGAFAGTTATPAQARSAR